ncbi:hypothetical protein DVH24_026588 [Malus domestica]|uniref:Uncharacterized protein n=1 Tax=Malus domestica TaxID=3750 RepID=A0A498HVW7_MALDO|nr:hypothetical protein DVH24_026588 [Malus domestica]
MSESSGSLLESGTRETLDDLPNRQTLAIASSSSMALVRGCFDAIPIVRSEFTADHLKNNLLDNEKQVEALRQSCNIPRSVGIRWYMMKNGLLSLPRSCYVLHPDITDFRVTRGTIQLFGQELSDIEKVLRVPKEDRHLSKLRPLFRRYGFQPLVSESQGRSMEKVSKKTGTSTHKRKAPVKTGVETVDNATAVVAGEGSRLLPHPLTMEHTVQESDPGSRHEGKGKERAGSVPWKDLRLPRGQRILGISTIAWQGVMAEYHDRLQEVERYKAKLKENKQLVDEARRNKDF